MRLLVCALTFAFVPLSGGAQMTSDPVPDYVPPFLKKYPVELADFYLEYGEAYVSTYNSFDLCGAQDIGKLYREFVRRLAKQCRMPEEVRSRMLHDLDEADIQYEVYLGEYISMYDKVPPPDGVLSCHDKLHSQSLQEDVQRAKEFLATGKIDPDLIPAICRDKK